MGSVGGTAGVAELEGGLVGGGGAADAIERGVAGVVAVGSDALPAPVAVGEVAEVEEVAGNVEARGAGFGAGPAGGGAQARKFGATAPPLRAYRKCSGYPAGVFS